MYIYIYRSKLFCNKNGFICVGKDIFSAKIVCLHEIKTKYQLRWNHRRLEKIHGK